MLPLVEEDRGPGKLLGDDPEVALDEGLHPGHGVSRRKLLQDLLEPLRRLAHHLQEELLLGLDVGVEAPALEVQVAGELPHAGGVVAPLAEEVPGDGEDLAPAVHG